MFRRRRIYIFFLSKKAFVVNKVSVSTLPMDFSKLEVSLFKVSNADYIHVDVMDGEFVDNETIWTEELEELSEKSDQVMDVHLMIEEPISHVEDFIQAGGDIINFHIEAAEKPFEVVEKVKENDAKAGVSVNPNTELSEIKSLLPEIDQVMIMSVYPGEGGQEFIEDVVEKIDDLRELDEEIDIEVDGGIDDETGKMCVRAGANILCSGSYVWSFDDPRIGVDVLRNV